MTAKLLSRAALLLLLGLATSIGIASAIAALKPNTIYPPATMGAFARWDRYWSFRETKGLGTRQISWLDLRATVARAMDLGQFFPSYRQGLLEKHAKGDQIIVRHQPPRWGTMARDSPPGSETYAGVDFAYGWPMVCVWDPVFDGVSGYEVVMEQFSDRGHWHFRTRSELKAGGPPDLARFPTRPLPLGLTVNTFAYASLWWLALFGPAALRRVIRRRQGRCPAYGYDLQANLTNDCPECGWKRST